MVAEVFAPGLVSGGAFEHSRLEIARDGTALYWVVQPVTGRQMIWSTRRAASGEWTPPAPLPITAGAEELPFLHSPTLAPDGMTLYFSCLDLGEEAGHGSAPVAQTYYAIDLENPRWDAPARIAAWFPDPDEVWGYSFAANGNLYFDCGFRLFCMELRGGRYDPPAKLGNAAIDDSEGFLPFVTPDESCLLYSSSRSDSIGGSIDLYVAFRRPQGGWDRPRHLGPQVNTAANERFPSLSPDGKYLFFLRNEPRGDSSYYWIDAAVLTEAE